MSHLCSLDYADLPFLLFFRLRDEYILSCSVSTRRMNQEALDGLRVWPIVWCGRIQYVSSLDVIRSLQLSLGVRPSRMAILIQVAEPLSGCSSPLWSRSSSAIMWLTRRSSFSLYYERPVLAIDLQTSVALAGSYVSRPSSFDLQTYRIAVERAVGDNLLRLSARVEA